MAGHSKWAQIKRSKGALDAKRGVLFSKMARLITIAAKTGTDPAMNFQLRMAVDRARAENMPKDNIDRAIEKAAGASGSAGFEEFLLEAYGPGGTAFLIEVATDNRNRAIGDIRAVINKYEAKLAEAGAVGYLFTKRGQIVLTPTDVDAAELLAIDAGATDFECDDGKLFVYTEPKELEAVRRVLADQGLASNDIGFEHHPNAHIEITDPKLAEKILKFSEALEDLDDVTRVASNFDIPADLLQ
jgi:YebC/PmpR family DNA-binding regulatory protein